MPHSTESIPITTKVNLTTQIIQGDIPNYYNGSFATSSQVFVIFQRKFYVKKN